MDDTERADLIERLCENGLDECEEAIEYISALVAKLAEVEAERDGYKRRWLDVEGLLADAEHRAETAKDQLVETTAALKTARRDALKEAAEVAEGQYRSRPTLGFRFAPDRSDIGRGVQRGKDQAAAAIRAALAALEADT